MANTLAELPEVCPHHGTPTTWIELAPANFFYCAFLNGTPNQCRWPVNKWTPESDLYADGEMWIGRWKDLMGLN